MADQALSQRYDLQDRFINFAVGVCGIAERLPRTPLGQHISAQLFRSGTSPMANYGEAQGAGSRRDFVHKLRICVKELREADTWLTLASRLGYFSDDQVQPLMQECDELLAISVTSVQTASRRMNKKERQ